MKRALVCAPRMPEFDRESGSRSAFHWVEALVGAGWAVTYLAQMGDNQERYAHMLRQMGVQTYSGPDSAQRGDDYLADPAGLVAEGRFDLALFIFWYTAEWLLPSLRSLSPRTRVLIHSGDLHFLRTLRARYGPASRGPGGLLADKRDAHTMLRELNTYASVDGVLTVSQKEADLLTDFLGRKGIAHLAPDMEDTPRGPARFADRRGIVYVANFRHPPNVEALHFLCDSVLPLVDPALLDGHPVYIVGNGLTPELATVARKVPNIRAVGWVPSVVPYLHRARVSVVPLLSGAGTKRKLLQALMAGTPSVSTSVGTEGLGLQDGRDVIIADDPAAFASAIMTLLEDSDLWSRVATAGQSLAGERHGPDAVRSKFFAVVDGLLAAESIR